MTSRLKKNWIGVDLDGTLSEYHKMPPYVIGKPIPAMVERVKQWIDEGREVRIFTARVDGGKCEWYKELPPEWQKKYKAVTPIVEMVQNWCVEHIGTRLPVTNCKDADMDVLWDDRCIQVERNTGQPINNGG